MIELHYNPLRSFTGQAVLWRFTVATLWSLRYHAWLELICYLLLHREMLLLDALQSLCQRATSPALLVELMSTQQEEPLQPELKEKATHWML